MNLSTRRRLLKTGLASALFAASGMTVVASPRRGGCLRLAIDAKFEPFFGLPADCDPAFALLATYAGVFDTLVEIAPDGTLRGELAECWSGSPDAQVWEFRLRDGVRFHNGAPLEAERVVRALKAHQQAWALRNVASIDVTGRLELRFELAEPDTGFPFLLSRPELAIHSGSGDTPQGTGLYRVTQHSPGHRLVAKRQQQPHNAGEGHFDRVEVILSEAMEDRLVMFQSGRVDALVEMAPDRLPLQFHLPDAQVGRARDSRFLLLDLSQLTGIDLRERLLSSIDSGDLVRTVLRGNGHPVLEPVPSKPSGPQAEIGVVSGPRFDETAARLVAGFSRVAARNGISICAGRGKQGTVEARWAGHDEARAVMTASETDQTVVLSADATGLVSRRLLGLGQTGGLYPLDDARIARRWWLA